MNKLGIMFRELCVFGTGNKVNQIWDIWDTSIRGLSRS